MSESAMATDKAGEGKKKSSVNMSKLGSLYSGWEHCLFLYYFITLGNFHFS